MILSRLFGKRICYSKQIQLKFLNNTIYWLLMLEIQVNLKQGIFKTRNIPVNELSSKLSSLSSYKDSEILVYCASEVSAKAADILYKNGFNKVYNLSGGYLHKGKLSRI